MKWLVLALLTPAPALACGLELILTTDVSGSIDQNEYRLQADGLAAAFRHESLIAAVERIEGGILVTHTQWSGASRQQQMTGWHHLTDSNTIARFSDELSDTRRVWRNFSTAIGEALVHAEAVSSSAPLTCDRRVIDVSGDGVSNEGRPPGPEAARLAARGYVVNGLVVKGATPDPEPHFYEEVIAGPGAFVETASDFDDYPRAILRKLLREIDPPLITSDLGQDRN